MSSNEYEIVRSKTRKRSAVIKVRDGGMVQVRAPLSMSIDFINDFVRRNLEWINQQKQSRHIIKNNVENGELWPYQGQVYPLRILPTRLKPKVRLENNIIWVHVNAKLETNMRRKLMINWYKANAKNIIKDLVAKYANLINKSYGTIRLKDTSSRWGSCSGEGNLNFNWRLVLAPHHVLEYVVIHEVCHLVHQHHKPTFWKLVESLDSEYRSSRTYLKHHGWKLRV